MRRLNPYGRRSGKRTLARRIALFAVGVAAVCCARTFHRSFRNGYPAEWNISKDKAEESFSIKGGKVSYSDGKGTVVKSSREIVGKVTRVSDGDTLWVTDSLGRHKIRLNRIDAPESDQPFGKEATAHLKSLVAGKSVRVEYSSTDQYGRVLGIVYLDGTDINLQMLRDGYAWHYKHFDSTPSYSAAELDARTAKRGLWSSPSPINPYTWRKSKR